MSGEDDGQRGRFSFLGTADLENLRESCSYRYAPSQAMMPPQPLASPDYPFQMVVADYCNIKGKSWLVLCDRFSGWLSV